MRHKSNLSSRKSRSLKHPQETCREMTENMVYSYWLLLSWKRSKSCVGELQSCLVAMINIFTTRNDRWWEGCYWWSPLVEPAQWFRPSHIPKSVIRFVSWETRSVVEGKWWDIETEQLRLGEKRARLSVCVERKLILPVVFDWCVVILAGELKSGGNCCPKPYLRVTIATNSQPCLCK